jgi:uncharacterized coiled-coil DUF342 family protein
MPMTRARKALILMVVATLGFWGCAREQKHPPGSARIKTLESKNAQLEDECRSAIEAKDHLRHKLQSLQAERAQLKDQLEQVQNVTKERDELREQVAARTTERDALQAQFNELRKGIKTLLGHAEEAVSKAKAGPPLTSTGKTETDENS